MPPPYELEAVLRADDWLRRIAQRLAGDSEASEDLVQDAWVAALTRRRADRPWLFGVLRNLRRSQERRSWRERDVRAQLEPPPGAPSTDDVVDELTLRKRVTDGLLNLDEPYRTALYLRYVNDESLPAIAKQCGVAPSTVHQRIQRGLELLRRELDDRYDGDRQAWALGLLSLAKPPGLAATLLGGAIVGTSVKIAAAVVVAGGLVAWWIQDQASPERDAAIVAAGPGAEAVGSNDAPVHEGPAPPSERVELVGAAPATPVDPVVDVATTLLRGHALELDGGPVAGLRVGWSEALDEDAPAAATTDVLGRFTLERDDSVPEGATIRSLDPRWVTLLSGFERDGEQELVVGRRARFAGTVVDAAGDPIEGAEVRFVLRQSLFRELGIIRPWGTDDPRPGVTTDASGWFELEDVAGGEQVGLLARANGYATTEVDLSREGDTGMRIVLRVVDDERLIQGIVYDSMGAPVPGASVAAGKEVATTAGDGSFRLAWSLEDAGDYVQGDDGVWRAEHDTSLLVAVKEGHLPARVPVADLDLSRTITLHLGGPPLSVEGRVVDETGSPLEGVVVWAADTTHFGHFVRDSGGGRAHVRVSIEELARGIDRADGVVTAADGTFRFDGLLDRDYDLLAYHPSSATRGGPWTVAAGSTSLELVVESEAGTQRVAGRVVSASGEPMADVYIRPVRSRLASTSAQPPWISGVVLGTSTDADGRFEFPALATEGTQLELQHEAFFIRHVDLDDYPDLESMEIVQASLCDLQIELEDAEFADQVELLDADGEALELLEHYGSFLSAGRAARFDEGQTNVLQVLETARTIVLSRDGEEVLRRPIELRAGELTSLRL